MDKEKFTEIMFLIEDFYSGKFKATERVMNSWYICLGNIKYECLRDSVIEYAKDHRQPPSIAELIEWCDLNEKRYDDGWQ